MRHVLRWFRYWWQREARARQLAEELRFHRARIERDARADPNMALRAV